MKRSHQSSVVLWMNTFAFTVCFAVWMMNGVLVTFLVDNRIFAFDKAQLGWLLGIPVLTGSIFRLPIGLATDRWGGRWVFPFVMMVAAAGAVMASQATDYVSFLLASLLFGFSGTGFSVGIAYTSVWFPRERQGTVLGIFGMGNAGSAVTSLLGPTLLKRFTSDGSNLDGWRQFPLLYAAVLMLTALAFVLATENRTPDQGKGRTIGDQLRPLGSVRVWRFGLYYFLVFGAFVALAQWLIPYYLNVYSVSLATAGLLASIFSLPSGLIRAFGGWLSDRFGARTVMYWVLGSCTLGCLALTVPRMEVRSPGEGVMASAKGIITEVAPDHVSVGEKRYPVIVKSAEAAKISDAATLVLPRMHFWQEPVVEVGQAVEKKQVLARGTTYLFFQANIWIFTVLVFFVGIAMGIGKAAVYKHIPEYFPKDVGVVGGIVGVIGGLGGFFCPIWFGLLLGKTGFWTTTWMVLFVVSLFCLAWMHMVVRGILRREAPAVAYKFENS